MIGAFLSANLLLSQGLFARTYGRPGEERAYSVISTPDGGYAVAGYAWSSMGQFFDFLVLKLSSAGELQWAKTIGGTDCDYAYYIDQTSDGGYFVTGWGMSYSYPYDDFFVVKISSTGDLEWARTFGGTAHDFAWSAIQCSDEGFVVVGETESFGAGYFDALILKLSPAGDLQWAKTFGGTSYDYVYSIIQTTDGGYAVAGRTRSFGTGLDDLLVLKLGADGDYSGCVQPCLPMVTSPNPSISSPSPTQTSPSLSISIPNLTITTPNLTMTDVCPPAVGEADIPGPRPGITCSPISGGAFFLSPGEMFLKVYTANGRLVYSEALRKGENKITLERGVYLWHAGPYKGKVIIR